MNAGPDRRHWRLCRLVLDPHRRRSCNCADLDPVLGPKEEEARLLRLAEEIAAAGRAATCK